MREGSEVNGDEVQEKIGSTSINQSDELHLIQNENLKELLDRNPDLKKEVEETEKLINTELQIQTIKAFDEIVDKITKLGFETEQKATETAEKLDEGKSAKELKSYLNAKKFCYYMDSIKSFEYHIFWLSSVEYDEYFEAYLHFFNTTSEDMDEILDLVDQPEIFDDEKDAGGFCVYGQQYQYTCNRYRKLFAFDECFPTARKFLIHSLKPLIKLRVETVLEHIAVRLNYGFLLTSEVILNLHSNQERRNFYMQWHKILEENLPNEDKQLFRDYLDSCREKLQNEKYKYLLFGTREKQLTGVVIFEIIASAVVLTISLLEIYVATWFFWFGIVGIVLTVAVGIRLFLCIKANCNYLQELENDLQKEGKTIQDKIAEIDRAIDVYDLNKIRDFKEPELKKISTIETDRNEIINNDEINSTEQNDAPESEQDNSEENIENISNP